MRRFARTCTKKPLASCSALGLQGIQRRKVTEGLEKNLTLVEVVGTISSVTIKKMYEIHYQNTLDFSKCNASFPYSVD